MGAREASRVVVRTRRARGSQRSASATPGPRSPRAALSEISPPTVPSPRRSRHTARSQQSQASSNRTTSRRSPLKFTRVREPCAARARPGAQYHRVLSRTARQFARASSPTRSEPSPKPAGRAAERARPARACAEVARRRATPRSAQRSVVPVHGGGSGRRARRGGSTLEPRQSAGRASLPSAKPRGCASVRATARRRRQRGALQVRLHVPPALARRRGVASSTTTS